MSPRWSRNYLVQDLPIVKTIFSPVFRTSMLKEKLFKGTLIRVLLIFPFFFENIICFIVILKYTLEIKVP